MSRDEVGAAPASSVRGAVRRPPPRGSPVPAAAPDPPGELLLHDDLDAPRSAPPPAVDGSSGSGSSGSGLSGGRRPGRRRGRAAALLVAGVLGAGGALSSVRASDAERASLVSLGSYPDSSSGTWGDDGELTLVVAVGNTGDQDLVVLAGGTRTAGGEALGTTAPRASAPAGDGAGADVAAATAIPAGGTGLLELTVSGSCVDPPPWDPWLRVRTPSGDTADVAVAVVDNPYGPSPTGFEDACSYARQDEPPTPSVVGQRSSDEGLVLQVRNDTDTSYGVEVLLGGVAGLELVDPDVVLEPARTTDVALRVAPRRCEAALGTVDLLSGVAIQATRSGDGEGEWTVRLDVGTLGAGTSLGVAVDRACATGA